MNADNMIVFDPYRYARNDARQVPYTLNMAPERAVGRSTAKARRTDDVADGDNSGQEDAEDCQVNVFLAGCSGLSRNALEKAIARQTRERVRIHRMRNSDHRRAQLHTPQCIQKLLALELLVVGQQEVRVIEWDPIRSDMAVLRGAAPKPGRRPRRLGAAAGAFLPTPGAREAGGIATERAVARGRVRTGSASKSPAMRLPSKEPRCRGHGVA